MQNVFDKIIGYINPVAGLRRLEARTRIALAEAVLPEVRASGYSGSGASQVKPGMTPTEWGDKSKDAWSDISKNLPILRTSSRSLYMTSGLARGAIERLRVYAIGTGLRLRSAPNATVLGLSPEGARAWADQVEARYKAYCESTISDAYGLQDDYARQRLLVSSWAMSGDVFALLTLTPNGDLRVKVTEADYCKTPDDQKAKDQVTAEGGTLQDGIEFNADGEIVAYHFARRHPLRSTFQESQAFVRIPVRGAASGRRNVCHLVEVERPGYFRGVPYLAPVIEDFRRLGEYTRAELAAALANAIFTGVIYSQMPDRDPLGETAIVPTGEDEEQTSGQTETDGAYKDAMLGYGNILQMQEGDRMELLTSTRPNGNFSGFNDAQAKYIGAGINMPHDVLTLNHQSSYTAARANNQAFWKWIEVVRSLVVQCYKRPHFEEWLTLQVLTGQIQAPGYLDDPFIRAAWLGAKWYGPALGSLNPLDEARAIKELLACAVTTRSRVSAELYGDDFDSIITELSDETQRVTDAGIGIPSPTSAAQTATNNGG